MKAAAGAGLGALALLLQSKTVQASRGLVRAQELTDHDAALAHRQTSFPGRQLLQYYGYGNNCDYYGNCNYWSGGRIAGVVVGIVFFVFAIVFLILAILMRRRRLARYQANQYPVTAAGPAYPNQGLQGPQGTYPQGTYPQGANYEYNQAYPQNTGGYNPAPASGYPATGQPVNYNNGVQMQPLPQEKPGYQPTV